MNEIKKYSVMTDDALGSVRWWIEHLVYDLVEAAEGGGQLGVVLSKKKNRVCVIVCRDKEIQRGVKNICEARLIRIEDGYLNADGTPKVVDVVHRGVRRKSRRRSHV